MEGDAASVGGMNDAINKVNNKLMEKTMIYYGYPLSIAGTYTLEKAIEIYKTYDVIVFGDGYQNPTHPVHGELVSVLNELHTYYPHIKTFGYIPIGGSNGANLSIDEIKIRVDQWDTLNIKGIFLDEYGYDFYVTRDRQNEIINYCRTTDKFIFANSWSMEYIFSNNNVIIDWLENFEGNPNLLPCLLNEYDYVLFEVNTWKIDGNQADAWDTHRCYDYYSEPKPEYNNISYYQQYKTKGIVLDCIMQADHLTDTEINKMTLSIMLSKIFGCHGIAFGDENWGSTSFYVDWKFPALDLYENINTRHITNVTYNGTPESYSAVINSIDCVANLATRESSMDNVKLVNPWTTMNDVVLHIYNGTPWLNVIASDTPNVPVVDGFLEFNGI